VSKQTGVGGCGGGCGGAVQMMVPKRHVLERLSPTPAQAANIAHRNGTYQDWVSDVPIQGPTDEGIRRADCWWKNNVLDKVTDNQGAVVPRWTQHSLCIGNRLVESGIGGVGDPIQMRLDGKTLSTPTVQAAGSPVASGAPTPAMMAAPASPGIWSKLSAAESSWVMTTLTQLNALILKAGNKPCATWPADPTKTTAAAVACFQGWFNTNSKPSTALRVDGTLDDASLCALVAVTEQHAADFTVPYPGTLNCGLSTLAKVGIGVGVAVVVGGTIAAIAAAAGGKKRSGATQSAVSEATKTTGTRPISKNKKVRHFSTIVKNGTKSYFVTYEDLSGHPVTRREVEKYYQSRGWDVPPDMVE
jgi:hypothetical protein